MNFGLRAAIAIFDLLAIQLLVLYFCEPCGCAR
jgi:hypothetical protein